MFLQYFIWGTWYVSMGSYLANHLYFGGKQIGAVYGAFAVGSMISPFFVGLIADRFFSSEKLLAILNLAGSLALFILARVRAFDAFYSVLILYCICFAPTLALGNSLSLHHLSDSKRDFPRVKVFSAIGWIGGGVVLSLLQGEQSNLQFYLASGVSAALGFFSLFLPHTPPKKVGQNVSWGDALGLDALSLMKRPSFTIFIICLFLICIPLYFYFVMMSIYLTELHWTAIAGKMALAQVSDVIFLFFLPVILKPLGYKKTIALGIFAWTARYFFLTESAVLVRMQTAFVFVAILLHGICYDFLFIVAQLFVDNRSNERNRGSAQGFIAFILWGVGSFVGTMLAGTVLAQHTLHEHHGGMAHDWGAIWMTPAIGALVVLIVFLFSFAEPAAKFRMAEAPASAP